MAVVRLGLDTKATWFILGNKTSWLGLGKEQTLVWKNNLFIKEFLGVFQQATWDYRSC